MADRYLLESGAPDGYLLEDGSGVLLLDPFFKHTQATIYNGTSTVGVLTGTASLTNNPSIGDVICVAVITFNSSPTITVQDDAVIPNVYTQAPSGPSNSHDTTAGTSWLFYLIAGPTATKNITVTLSTNPAGVFAVYIDSFTPSGGSAVFDTDAIGQATGAIGTSNLPSLTPGTANELLYAHGVFSVASTGVGAAWKQNDHGVGMFGENAEYILNASVATAVAFTMSGTNDYDAYVMAFKIVAPAGSPGAITGICFAGSSSSSALTGAGQLAGVVVAAASSTSVLVGAGSLIGVSAGTPTTSATSSGSGALQGSAVSATISTSVLAGKGALLGISVEVLSSTAALINIANPPVFAIGSSVAFGLLTGVGTLAGTSASAAASTSALAGSGALQGESLCAGAYHGALTGDAALIGSSVSLLVTLAILINQGFVDFFVANAFAIAAVDLSLAITPAVSIDLNIDAIEITLEVTQ